MKACGIVVASLTSGSPSSRARLVTGSRMSPQREPDQTPCEVRARAATRPRTRLCVSAGILLENQIMSKTDGGKKEMKTLDMDTFFKKTFHGSNFSDRHKVLAGSVKFPSVVIPSFRLSPDNHRQFTT